MPVRWGRAPDMLQEPSLCTRRLTRAGVSTLGCILETVGWRHRCKHQHETAEQHVDTAPYRDTNGWPMRAAPN
eukprot:12923046-Prorocentrum_lima.AAC.1